MKRYTAFSAQIQKFYTDDDITEICRIMEAVYRIKNPDKAVTFSRKKSAFNFDFDNQGRATYSGHPDQGDPSNHDKFLLDDNTAKMIKDICDCYQEKEFVIAPIQSYLRFTRTIYRLNDVIFYSHDSYPEDEGMLEPYFFLWSVLNLPLAIMKEIEYRINSDKLAQLDSLDAIDLIIEQKKITLTSLENQIFFSGFCTKKSELLDYFQSSKKCCTYIFQCLKKTYKDQDITTYIAAMEDNYMDTIAWIACLIEKDDDVCHIFDNWVSSQMHLESLFILPLH